MVEWKSQAEESKSVALCKGEKLYYVDSDIYIFNNDLKTIML